MEIYTTFPKCFVKINCISCRLDHPERKCSARYALCHKCGIAGHFARRCYKIATSSHKSSSLLLRLKKKRDQDRMTTFIRKKNYQSLPFYYEEDSEIHNWSFNSLSREQVVPISSIKKDADFLVNEITKQNVFIPVLYVKQRRKTGVSFFSSLFILAGEMIAIQTR